MKKGDGLEIRGLFFRSLKLLVLCLSCRLFGRCLNEEKFGYSSRAEFVKDAIRRYLEWFGYYPPKKRKCASKSS